MLQLSLVNFRCAVHLAIPLMLRRKQRCCEDITMQLHPLGTNKASCGRFSVHLAHHSCLGFRLSQEHLLTSACMCRLPWLRLRTGSS